MNKQLKLAAVTVSLLFTALAGFAQNYSTGYFQNGYMYKYRLNPAFANDKGFLGLAIGNVGVSFDGNVNPSNYIYKNPDPSASSDSWVSFQDPSVSADAFEKSIHSFNAEHADVNVDLLAFGFRAGESTYVTFDLSAKSSTALGMPKDALSFMKRGVGGSYDMSGMYGITSNYVELAVGFSTDINEKVRVGARIKGLAGAGFGKFRTPSLKMDGEGRIHASGELAASALGLKYSSEGGRVRLSSLEFGEIANARPTGFGAALDLGFAWDVMDGLTVSGALLDLGGINWKRDVYATIPEGEYVYDTDAATPQEGDEVLNDMDDVLQFVSQNASGAFERLTMTARLGAEYKMPFYDKMSVGLLGTFQSAAYYTLAEARASLNIAPVPWIGLSASGAFGTYGTSFGAGFNLQAGPFNLLIGSDHVFTRVPFLHPGEDTGNLRSTLLIGLNLQFGKRRRL